jgi:hypothetical protein
MQLDWDASAVDWNCDGDESDSSLNRNINQGVSWNNNSTLDTLTSQNDWTNLIFTGGAISAPGASIALPKTSEIVDVSLEEDDDIAPTSPGVDAWVKAPPGLIPSDPGVVKTIPIWYNNYGMTTAANTVISLTLDANLSFIADTASVTPKQIGNQVVWDFGDLPLTGGGYFEVQVAVPNDSLGTAYTSQLDITSAGTETDPADNSLVIEMMIMTSVYLPSIQR